MPIILTNQKLAQATPLIDLHGSGQILFFFFLTAYINTSQLISNTTIPNDNMFHTPLNLKPRKPRTALVDIQAIFDGVANVRQVWGKKWWFFRPKTVRQFPKNHEFQISILNWESKGQTYPANMSQVYVYDCTHYKSSAGQSETILHHKV